MTQNKYRTQNRTIKLYSGLEQNEITGLDLLLGALIKDT